jgi:serine protease Do
MPLTALEEQVTQAVEKLGESVVSIDSTRFARDFSFGLVPVEGQGSGVIIDQAGFIITNYHVIDGAARVTVVLKDGRTFSGEVVGGDPSTDVAVVKVEAKNLPAAQIGDAEHLKVGQFVLAIGNALGLPGGPTVSIGVVSALGRPLPGTDFIFEGLIQTDTAINPGNSGGPLADLQGNVIGINTAMIPYAQGVGFAIPISTVKATAQQILENGRVIRPWLGISGTSLNPAIARRYNLPAETGVLIVEVAPDSPAYEAGLREGDTIVSLGDDKVQSLKDLLKALSKRRVGEEVIMQVLRMGTQGEVSLRLQEAPVRAVPRRRIR